MSIMLGPKWEDKLVETTTSSGKNGLPFKSFTESDTDPEQRVKAMVPQSWYEQQFMITFIITCQQPSLASGRNPLFK